MRAWIRMPLVAVAVLVADQVSKSLVRRDIPQGEHRDLILGIDLAHVRNDGIAFSLFGGGGWILTAVTCVAVVALVGYFATHPAKPLLWLPTGLLVGGALGNLIDRVRDGAVTDFVDLSFWPTFNVADMAITIGVVLLVLTMDGGGGRRVPDATA